MKLFRNLTSRLSVRVVTPIFLLWAIAGFIMYSGVLSTITDFMNSRIHENLTSLARDVFLICNRNLDRLILEGKAGDPRYGRIIQVRTLSEIEIILRENNGLALIYTLDQHGQDPEVIFDMGIEVPPRVAIEATAREQSLTPLQHGETNLYTYHTTFEPWDWHILIFKPNRDFRELQTRIQRVYVFSICALTLGAMLVVVLLHFLVNRPLSSIIASLKRNEPPRVQGVHELEFLSETIATMMDSLAAMNRGLEHEVALRTRDLSEKAAQLELANAKLKELDRMKSAFLSSVSHELRTPLTSVLGFAKMIDRDLVKHLQPVVDASGNPSLEQKMDRLRNNLTIIESESERLTRLINDVLDLSRIEDGRMEWSDQPVDVGAAVRQAVNALRGQMETRPDVRIQVEVPQSLPPVHVDADRFQQLLLNILGNALKFTERGRVCVQARYAPDAGCLLCIHDTGPGIERGNLQKVFESFYQGSEGDTVTRNQRGTGLGLAICRQIVEHYGGVIWLESSAGRGTSVYLELPPK